MNNLQRHERSDSDQVVCGGTGNSSHHSGDRPGCVFELVHQLGRQYVVRTGSAGRDGRR